MISGIFCLRLREMRNSEIKKIILDALQFIDQGKLSIMTGN
jgi:hypothetical protein